MKRARESVEIQGLDIAKCLMLLSQGQGLQSKGGEGEVFECKTCHRCFPSFQALGGHRASHKRPKLIGDKPAHFLGLSSAMPMPRIHDCSICGQGFSTGQALGGHMRKHRLPLDQSFPSFPLLPVLKRSNTSRRVVCLDLNLTPLENDLQVLFGNKPPKVDLCISYNT